MALLVLRQAHATRSRWSLRPSAALPSWLNHHRKRPDPVAQPSHLRGVPWIVPPLRLLAAGREYVWLISPKGDSTGSTCLYLWLSSLDASPPRTAGIEDTHAPVRARVFEARATDCDPVQQPASAVGPGRSGELGFAAEVEVSGVGKAHFPGLSAAGPASGVCSAGIRPAGN